MKLKITSRIIAIVVPVVFFGGIAVSAALGWWVTEASKTPARYEEGEFAGEYNPGDIRGSYTFGDIESAFGVPADLLARAFGVEATGPATEFAVKNLEEIYEGYGGELEIGTDAVRWFVALFTDLPYEPDEGTAMTEAGLEILLEEETIDQTTADRMAERVVSLAESGVDPSDIAVADDGEDDGESDDERLIKGNTTFGELKMWGLSEEQIESIIGIPVGTNADTMRDFFSAAGVEFSSVKDQLQEAVDAAR